MSSLGAYAAELADYAGTAHQVRNWLGELKRMFSEVFQPAPKPNMQKSMRALDNTPTLYYREASCNVT
jgi:hypothetical protein